MLSGCAASRTVQLSDTASQYTFGGCQGGHHPRWQNPSRVLKALQSPSGMVDPLGHKAIPPSPAEPKGQRDFA
jgi:hypothetical protein